LFADAAGAEIATTAQAAMTAAGNNRARAKIPIPPELNRIVPLFRE